MVENTDAANRLRAGTHGRYLPACLCYGREHVLAAPAANPPIRGPLRGPVRRRPAGHDWRRRPIALIIEDEEGPRTYYRRALAPHASEILAAETGSEGLRLAIERQPDILVLDLVLPGVHGIQVLEKVRFHGVLARVIVVSGQLTDELEEQAWRLGALAVLEKVVTLERLIMAFQMAAAADGPLGSIWRAGLEGTAAERWVSLILRSLQVPRDPRTTREVAARGGMSLSQMKTICGEAQVRTRHTCSLARALGGVVWSRRLLTGFESLMDIGDVRTLRHLVEQAAMTNKTATATVRDILDGQRFVPADAMAFRLLRRALLGEWRDDDRWLE